MENLEEYKTDIAVDPNCGYSNETVAKILAAANAPRTKPVSGDKWLDCLLRNVDPDDEE